MRRERAGADGDGRRKGGDNAGGRKIKKQRLCF